MTTENIQRLEHILNQLTYRYAPERGITAYFIAVCLNAWGVTAPAPPKPVPPQNPYLAIAPCPICSAWGELNHANECPNG